MRGAYSLIHVDNRSDTELIETILSGKIDDFRLIVSRHKNMAYSTAYSILRNKEEAEDAVQESFIKAYKSLRTFEGKSKFSTWFFRIIYYTALTKYQNTRHQRSFVDLEGHDSAGHQSTLNEGLITLNSEERTKFLERAMDRLGPEDKMAITLYYIDEKSQQKIAELMGWNLSATKVRIHRARIKLESYLNQILSDEKKSLL